MKGPVRFGDVLQIQNRFAFLDIDECASSETNQCGPNSLCTNTEGWYICRCLRGYQGDGLNCSGIN